MQRRAPPAPIKLSASERKALTDLSKMPGTRQALALRSRLVLACATGQTNTAIAAAHGVSAETVSKWRGRYLSDRAAGLRDGKRAGAPRQMEIGDLEWVLTLTLLATPADDAHWTTRSMAEACSMSQSAISRTWRGFGLRPSSKQKAHLRANALVLAKFEDLLHLYLDPRPRAQVRVHRVKSRAELRDWLGESNGAVALADRADVILTECGAAAEAEARAWLVGRPRFTLHMSPRGKHWVELVGRWFPAENGSGPRHGLRQLAFERDSAPYAWTPLGREMIESTARAITRWTSDSITRRGPTGRRPIPRGTETLEGLVE